MFLITYTVGEMCGRIRDYLITLFFHWFIREENLWERYLEGIYVQQSFHLSIGKLEVKYKYEILQQIHELPQIDR